ncbi:hypothetical protein HN51_046571 [Arachis hypogaea]
MVAEVRQRVSNMAGVTKEEVRIVASSYRICPLGAHIDHQEILKSKFGSATRLGINGPWITKSYLEMILHKKKGVSHHKKAREMPSSMLTGHWLRILKTRRNTFVPGSQGTAIIAPKPIRATPDLVTGLEDLSQP